MTHFDAAAWDAFHGRKTDEVAEASWDKRADSYALAGHSEYADTFLRLMKPEPGWTALDIGCGPGTIALPLAHQIAHVTGLDLSSRMLEVLRKRADDEKLGNISTIHGSWNDDWDEIGVPVVDVAYASRSFAAPNLPGMLKKLDSHARRRVCLTTIHGDMPRHDRRLLAALGRPMPASPDYIAVYDCLYDMGICATVDFIESEWKATFNSPTEARTYMAEQVNGVSEDEALRLDAFVEEHLVRAGDAWAFDYERSWCWAFIAWDK